MIRKYIIGTYAIGSLYVGVSNLNDFHFSNNVIDLYWRLPRLDTEYGPIVAGMFLSLSPFLIPVHLIVVPIISGIEYVGINTASIKTVSTKD